MYIIHIVFLMRLKSNEISAIQFLCRKYFGDEANAYLFGSRIYDELRGGDIDIFISASETTKLTLENKLRFLVELKLIIGDRKIDVILDNDITRAKTNFYRSIQSTKIPIVL